MAQLNRRYFESRLNVYLKEDITDKQEGADKIAEDIMAKMENVGWDIYEALISVIPTIENVGLRLDCRRVLIAEKFGAAEYYQMRASSREPWVSFVGDKCVLIDCPDPVLGTTTAILSQEGNVKTPNGKIWVAGNSLSFRWCFTARGVGDQREKYGLVSGDGDIVLPPVFNYIENDVVIEAQYKGVSFSVTFSDVPTPDEESFYGEYKLPNGEYMDVMCLGLKTEHSYSESGCAPLYEGKPLNGSEKDAYEDRISAEVFAMLNAYFG